MSTKRSRERAANEHAANMAMARAAYEFSQTTTIYDFVASPGRETAKSGSRVIDLAHATDTEGSPMAARKTIKVQLKGAKPRETIDLSNADSLTLAEQVQLAEARADVAEARANTLTHLDEDDPYWLNHWPGTEDESRAVAPEVFTGYAWPIYNA